MKKTALVIMAAGIGSRFGKGIKQLAPVGPKGEIIMDYSIHDALEAGFNKVVFIIRKDLEEEFRKVIGERIEKIRTYNFPQGRVTDHRIKLTLHRLENILNGDLDEIIDSLIAADQAAKLSNLQDEE